MFRRFFDSTKKEKKAFKTLLAFLVALSAIYFLTEPYHTYFYDIESLRSFISSFGILAPLALILIQIGQVLIAPIPGPVVGAASGYIFGIFWGTVYGFIGVAIGSALAILLAKRYGRPFVEDVLADETLEKFDKMGSEHGFLPFFLLFLLPGFPDDAICFIAGLTELDTKKLILLSSLGRIPGLLSLTVTGSSFATSNYVLMAFTGFMVIIVSLAAYYAREHVISPTEGMRNPFQFLKRKVEDLLQ